MTDEKGQQSKRICIAGIGNTIRSDDGIGAYICSKIEDLRLPGVDILTAQQLHVEMIETFLRYNDVIIADAAASGDDIAFYKLSGNTGASASYSHHIDAGLLQSLARSLFEKNLSVYVCAVPGENFEMGEMLSGKGKANADKAVAIIVDWIRQ